MVHSLFPRLPIPLGMIAQIYSFLKSLQTGGWWMLSPGSWLPSGTAQGNLSSGLQDHIAQMHLYFMFSEREIITGHDGWTWYLTSNWSKMDWKLHLNPDHTGQKNPLCLPHICVLGPFTGLLLAFYKALPLWCMTQITWSWHLSRSFVNVSACIPLLPFLGGFWFAHCHDTVPMVM